MAAHNQYGAYAELGERHDEAMLSPDLADVERLVRIAKPKSFDHAVEAGHWRVVSARRLHATPKQRRGMLLQAMAEFALAIRAIDRGQS